MNPRTFCIFLAIGLQSTIALLDDYLPLTFSPAIVKNVMDNATQVYIISKDCSIFDENLQIVADHHEHLINFDNYTSHFGRNETHCWNSFNITGVMLGKAVIKIAAPNGKVSKDLQVIVVRKKTVLDMVFLHCVIILMGIIYINFGCALRKDVLFKIIKKPIGPVIGFFSQFLAMPLIAYAMGKILFPDSPEMQLGMFFTGISPAGGASNVWAVVLEANVNLSVAMTTISNICALGMFPFWLFTLGNVIFAQGRMETPYMNIMKYVIMLVIPLGIGLLCQRFFPRFSEFMARILKPFSSLLIIFIIVFASVTNTYLFELFTWRIALAGMALPWLGYFAGFFAAWGLRQPFEDILAIAIETGVQNTGIAIFMLHFTLEDPAGDLTTVIPVAVAIMTPIPLFCLYVAFKLRKRFRAKMGITENSDVDTAILDKSSVNAVSYDKSS